jgi:glycerophosphoryl diester phosphodiesterase
VNRKATMVRLAEMGVDGIISDRTDLLAQASRR